MEILSLDTAAAELAGRMTGDLNRIGRADPMFVATAIDQGLELVTCHITHYQRIQQLGYPLTPVNWRR